MHLYIESIHPIRSFVSELTYDSYCSLLRKCNTCFLQCIDISSVFLKSCRKSIVFNFE